jgi:hypothetical protein
VKSNLCWTQSKRKKTVVGMTGVGEMVQCWTKGQIFI